VDESRLRFLFGDVPEDVDLGGEDERLGLLRADRPERDGVWPPPSLRLVIANQILDDKPSETWETAQRLLGCDMDRHEVMNQLVLALLPFVVRALFEEQRFNPDAYAAALARLPLPDPVAVFAAYLDVAREQVAIDADELDELVAARVGLDLDDSASKELLDLTCSSFMEDPDSPLTILAPDTVVHVAALTDGIVLTHRLSAAERTGGYLELDTDLAGFLRRPQPRVAAGPLTVDEPDDGGPVSWGGPPGWLADLPLDVLLAVRATAAGEVTISVLDSAPVAPQGLVATLRAVYDVEVEEPWLPVTAEEIVLGMLHQDRAAFVEPRPPLTELTAAAGLERCGPEFAHEASVWESSVETDVQFSLMKLLGPGAWSHAADEAFELLTEQADDPSALRRALDLVEQPDDLIAVTDKLLGPDDDPERVASLVALADRMVAAAGRSPRAAVAGWVATLAAERDGRVLDAESHLRAACRACAGWPFVEDRLAWYESDRGDAAAALGRWQAVGVPENLPDVDAVRRLAAVTAPELGRNAPCWCGSGRKFKQCHLGKPAAAPLPDRIGWLYRKAVAYLERRGGAVELAMILYTRARAGDLSDVEEAFGDPIVVDTVLHEGGWFERFLADRGPLLPADEALLAASWLLVERTVYEVTEVRPGSGMTLRDLRTDDRTDVTESTFSRSATVGALVCARAVPDGAGHQFVGGALTVPPGRERELLALLDERDGFAFLEWLAALTAPPTLTSADGEAIVACTAVLRVPSTTSGTSVVLDARYERTEPGWTWLGPGDRVLAMMELDGDELTVRSFTAPRMDQLLDDLAAALPGSKLRSRERSEVDTRAPAELAPPPAAHDPATIEQLQDRFERRWCEEEVPALDGHTPRAAVADPTRRDDVVRLIASFPEIDTSTGTFGLRPHRLRELLGLA